MDAVVTTTCRIFMASTMVDSSHVLNRTSGLALLLDSPPRPEHTVFLPLLPLPLTFGGAAERRQSPLTNAVIP
eukprot:scaffold489360_cov18-Prasinocladus_malaysianus.AAC.1